jgi:anti-sigma factor RsiW
MSTETRIGEFDLLAYADGRLEADPARLAEVERALRADPELAARAESYRAQTAALRRAYGPRLAEPVPERLGAALEAGRRRSAGVSARVAAALLVIAAAGAGGWVAGRAERGLDESTMRAFLAHAEPPAVAAGAPGPRLAQAGSGAPLNWLSEEVSFRLGAPDLSKLGFALVGRSAVDVDGRRAVRLTYRAADGDSFHLFLRPRWRDRDPEVRFGDAEGLRFAYWADGPLSSAVAADLPRARLAPIVDAIRQALRRGGAEPPAGIDGAGTPVTAGERPTTAAPPAPALAPGRTASPSMRPISGADEIRAN